SKAMIFLPFYPFLTTNTNQQQSQTKTLSVGLLAWYFIILNSFSKTKTTQLDMSCRCNYSK
ncbi:hypothetical protein, partial [Leuconostoc falkenbergense]|uniref:hypothetical protein n=1 Tax=Leuconostoc falkenbergense TaxID=2766470 RepID=UPI003BAEA35A